MRRSARFSCGWVLLALLGIAACQGRIGDKAMDATFYEGSLGNPVGFLVLAVKPSLRQHPTSPFGAAMTVSFALTTVGYAGAAWSVGRAALLAL